MAARQATRRMGVNTVTTLLIICVALQRTNASCDEAAGFEPDKDPHAAWGDYVKANKLYPTHTVLGSCTKPVDGYTTSLARPALFETPMFTDKAGTVAHNNAHMDLPVAHSFKHQGRHMDVYQTMTLRATPLDLFAGARTEPTLSAAVDSCRPEGYKFTEFYAYTSPANGAAVPGPVHKNCAGRQSVVRFCNDLPNNYDFSVHLHGAASSANYDGWAEDRTHNQFCKDYFYPNNRPTMLWYHDHTLDFTADGVSKGLASMYFVRGCDTYLEQKYLPKDKYNIPLMIRDAILADKLSPNGELPLDYQGGFRTHVGDVHKDNLFGDIVLANSRLWPYLDVELRVPWPYLDVEPRVYRFSQLAAAPSRQWSFKFIAETGDGRHQAWMDFYLIGTDGGSIQSARKLKHIYTTVAERWEYLMNFDPKHMPALPAGATGPWKYVYMVNDYGLNPGDMDPQFCKTHTVARFNLLVLPKDTSAEFDCEVDHAWPPPTNTAILDKLNKLQPHRGLRNLISNEELEGYKKRAMAGDFDRQFDFQRGNGYWRMNGATWHDLDKRIIANPSRDGIELWQLKRIIANPARDSIELWQLKGHGGWHHPVHIHLIDFLIVRGDGRDKEVFEDFDALTLDAGAFSSLDPLACADDADCPRNSVCDASAAATAATAAATTAPAAVAARARDLRSLVAGTVSAAGASEAAPVQLAQFSVASGTHPGATSTLKLGLSQGAGTMLSVSWATNQVADANSIVLPASGGVSVPPTGTSGTSTNGASASTTTTTTTTTSTTGTASATTGTGAAADPIVNGAAAGSGTSTGTTAGATAPSQCTNDEFCPVGTYCIDGACAVNGLRDWEQDSPKDVAHLSNGNTLWVLTRFGPNEADYMFHCHNAVHEDNAMMLAFGVGRKKGDPALWDAGRGVVTGDDNFEISLATKNTPVDKWTAQPYRKQPGLKAVFGAYNGFSPVSIQNADGTMNADMRKADSDVTFPIDNPPELTKGPLGAYCHFLTDGIYDVMYSCARSVTWT
ncbi:hypothetical protein JKP88DRAFT_273957 [Tribonema minus]|uniref:Plastocyanin-like domain-containing protein n=1 Tax=Tribonema minus TaxID=303371 RepID=A0A835YP50_9STRA|nr:hypothetical protein JKP88DRAFT_273957 [Tribonema minus]